MLLAPIGLRNMKHELFEERNELAGNRSTSSTIFSIVCLINRSSRVPAA